LFGGPTVDLSLTAGQRVIGAVSASIMSNSTTIPGELMAYGLCYQATGGAITNFFNTNYILAHKPLSLTNFSATAAVALPAGTYKVGFCIKNESAAPIGNSDFVNGWFMVANP